VKNRCTQPIRQYFRAISRLENSASERMAHCPRIVGKKRRWCTNAQSWFRNLLFPNIEIPGRTMSYRIARLPGDHDEINCA